MTQRPIGRPSCLIHLSSIIISISTAVIAIIILSQKNNNNVLNIGSVIFLIVGEVLNVFSFPLLLLNSKSLFWLLIPLNFISSALSLGAGLSLVNFLITSPPSINTNIEPKWLISLISLFIASQFFHGLSLSSYIHSYQKLMIEGHDSDDNENLREKMISLKASAATLVENRKASGNQESAIAAHYDLNGKDQASSIFQSTKSRFGSKVSLGASDIIKKVPIPNSIQLYSIKKLSFINQSHSSTNISLAQSHHTSIVSNSQPSDPIVKDAQTEKNLRSERDALKRIPSALLPPHLKVQAKQQQLDKHLGKHLLSPHSYSQPDLRSFTNKPTGTKLYGPMESTTSLKETIPELIPRAATTNDIFTTTNLEQNNGIKTITPTDYEKGYEDFQFQQLRGSFEPSKRLQKSAHFGDSDPTDDDDELSLSEDDHNIDEEVIEEDVVSNGSNQSTEEAMKFIQDAHEKGSNEFIRDVIDQSKSKLELERIMTPTTLTKTKSYSPHKSIFRGHGHFRNHSTTYLNHGRKDSSTSLSFKNFSMSMPTSPKKKSIMNSPRKSKIKNLSLSSIVFKADDDDIPNFSYVHELQSSPTKKRRGSVVACTPTKNHNPNNGSISDPKLFDDELEDKSNSPKSNWSDNSSKSVFPSEVIGEYDKEKWKTMERLHLVKQGDNIDDHQIQEGQTTTAS